MPTSNTPHGVPIGDRASDGRAIGYGDFEGGEVTQLTSRTTSVEINKVTGKIHTIGASLAAETSAKFRVSNSFMRDGDLVILSLSFTAAMTSVVVSETNDGSFWLTVINGNPAGGSAESNPITITFAIFKGAALATEGPS